MIFAGAFWAILLGAFAAGRLFGTTPRRRALVYALTALAGIGVLLDLSVLQGGALAASVASITIAARMLARDRRMALALIGIAFTTIIWVVGKALVAADVGHALPLLFVGISYLLVKAWSLFKDILDGKIKVVDPVEVVAYLIHLPTLVLGPMHQFSEFRAGLENPYRLDAERLIDAVFRIVLGLFKIYVVAALLGPLSLPGLVDRETVPLSTLIQAAFLYSIVLYCDFSGFCDLAIATSRLIGMDVPENFNWPYISQSVRDFWRRWHITFSRALTAHVFTPVSRALARRSPKSPAKVVAISYLVTFTFCGYWHGATANFIVWGLWHALGLIVVDWNTRSRRAAGINPLTPKPLWRQGIDIAVTFSFVSIGWIFFALPLSTLARVTGG